MTLSISGFSGVADEHNHSPLVQRQPLPVAESAPPAKVAKLAPIRTKKRTPELRRVAEPRQWTGLSSQIASDYQHDDEHAQSSAPTVHSTAAVSVESANPLPLPAVQPRPRPNKLVKAQVKAGQAPAARPFGPKQWAGLSAELAEADFPHAECEDEHEDEARPRQERQKALSPSSAPPTRNLIGVELRSVAKPVARARAGLVPLQWLGLSQEGWGPAASASASTLHNMLPSPENNRQRQRRISREIESERESEALKAAEALATSKQGKENRKVGAEDFQHARPTESAVQEGGVASYFDCSPISLMSAN